MLRRRPHCTTATGHRLGGWLVILVVGLMVVPGCRNWLGTVPEGAVLVDDGRATIANPLMVPLIDRWLVMDQVSDELDNYFRIYREERIRVLDGVMSEGWIETHPEMGSTLLEPWRKDSSPGFEKLHATLQTVRRFAKVRVIPAGDHYQIDVKVYKELEDLPQPLGARVGGSPMRYDSALDIDGGDVELSPRNDGWIPMGRDVLLEQTILTNIQSRLNDCMGR